MASARKPSLNLLLLAVGTHGDIQPFIAVGRKLQAAGHRVRLATHASMRPLVERHSLEFYPLGGDPHVLAEFAAESRGAHFELSLANCVFPRGPGQVRKVRAQVKAYLMPQLAACTERDPQRPGLPAFMADAIVANPISYGGPHLADHLGVPLHYLFTMPYSTTSEFPHPQARFLHEKRYQLPRRWERRVAPLMRSINRESYSGVFNAMFMGVIDIIDTFRRKVLHTDSIYCLKGYNAMFEPAPFRHGIAHSPAVTAATAPAARRTAAPAPDVEKGLRSSPGAAKDAGPAATATARDADGAHSTAAAAQSYAAKRVRGARDNWAPEWSAPVPRSYCFSPSLVPRPADWPAHVNAVGFCRDPNAGDDSNYVPPPELEAFLAQGPKPVYIGFGSMTIDDPEELTRVVLSAVEELGLRVIIGKGWGGLGVIDGAAVQSPQVHVVDTVPHGWLFPRCAAAVHHGGAGTTAASTAAGIPTAIVPFFGDQPYWGGMCWRRGVGAAPVAVQKLTKARLLAQLRVLMQPEVIEAAAHLGSQMQQERDGAEAFVDVLHEHLTRWQQHCGVGFPAHGASAAAAVADAQPRASTAGDGASMPARPSDSSSSLASPEAAAAYDKELKVLTARQEGSAEDLSHDGHFISRSPTASSPAASPQLSPASSAVDGGDVADSELAESMEQGWQYGQPNRHHSAAERRLYARKRMPYFSWWVEGAVAIGHISMLGVTSTIPFKTTFKQK